MLLSLPVTASGALKVLTWLVWLSTGLASRYPSFTVSELFGTITRVTLGPRQNGGEVLGLLEEEFSEVRSHDHAKSLSSTVKTQTRTLSFHPRRLNTHKQQNNRVLKVFEPFLQLLPRHRAPI